MSYRRTILSVHAHHSLHLRQNSASTAAFVFPTHLPPKANSCTLHSKRCRRHQPDGQHHQERYLSGRPRHRARLQWRRSIITASATSPPPSPPSPSTPTDATEDAVQTPPVIFVLGGPGSGKGTQCVLLQEHFDLPQLCVGDLLRQEADSGSEVGRSVAEIMQRGDIVPGHVTMALLRRELALLAGRCAAVLIDGFPRAMDQALQFEELVTTCEFVLYFKCDPDVMLKRLRGRAETSGRADDVEDVFTKRLDTFYSKTMPVIEHYRKNNLLREVDAETGSVDQVFAQTSRYFNELIGQAR